MPKETVGRTANSPLAARKNKSPAAWNFVELLSVRNYMLIPPMGPQKVFGETTYSAESYLASPPAMLRRMFRDLSASRELAWRLMARDLRARYRQSFLGFAWAFVPPLFMAGVLTLAQDAKLVNVGSIGVPYPAFILLGMALWQTFTDALNAPTQAMIGAKSLLGRLKFPHEALIMAKLGEAAFDFAVKLVLLLAAFQWFEVPIRWPAVLLAPAALLTLALFGLFVGLLLLPLAMLLEDVSRTLALATAVWFWVTPVAYNAPGDGLFGTIVRLNPVTPLLTTTRDLALGGTTAAPAFWAVAGASALGTLLAWAAFRLAAPFVIERYSH